MMDIIMTAILAACVGLICCLPAGAKSSWTVLNKGGNTAVWREKYDGSCSCCTAAGWLSGLRPGSPGEVLMS